MAGPIDDVRPPDPATLPGAYDLPTPFSIVHVEAVNFELPSPSPVLTLQESATPYRRLRIPIGLPEAQVIAQAIFDMVPARPLTHELFASVLKRNGIEIVAVRITGVVDGIFRAELDTVSPAGHELFDCRPTDGVILALRQGVVAPILVSKDVLAALGDR